MNLICFFSTITGLFEGEQLTRSLTIFFGPVAEHCRCAFISRIISMDGQEPFSKSKLLMFYSIQLISFKFSCAMNCLGFSSHFHSFEMFILFEFAVSFQSSSIFGIPFQAAQYVVQLAEYFTISFGGTADIEPLQDMAAIKSNRTNSSPCKENFFI